jgi:hypothetical protein
VIFNKEQYELPEDDLKLDRMSGGTQTAYLPTLNIRHTHPTICCHIIHKYNNTTFIVLISDFYNKEQYELPEGDLKMDRNMLESFKYC